MCNRLILVFLFGMVLKDSTQEHVKIEQTNGYNDTWTNINSTCSLLGLGLAGNAWDNQVTVDNINDITEPGWISAHVEHEGTLQFIGCEYGTVLPVTPRLKVTHDRIPQCIYFCKSSRIALHRDYCYCTSNIILDYPDSHCFASDCGINERLFCGQSEQQQGKQCMCRYQNHNTNINSAVTVGSCRFDNVVNCRLFKHLTKWQVNCGDDLCALRWNGFVKREVFYWGSSSSVIRNEDYCVAIGWTSQLTKRPTLITLPCSSKQTGICIKGTRTLTTRQTTQQTTERTTSTDDFTSRTPLTSESESVKQHQKTDITEPKIGRVTTLQSVSESSVDDQKTIIIRPNLVRVTTIQSRSESSVDDQKTNISGPIIGGVVSCVVVLVGVIIVGVLIKRRRRKADSRPKPPRELNSFSTSKHEQNQYINCGTDHPRGQKQIHAVDNRAYDSLQNRTINPEYAVLDLYDHTSEAGDNMYGRLNQNGRGNVTPVNADIYDHSRAVVQLNGDTYDCLQTGVGREDCSEDYYDHTGVGEDYGYLEKGDNRKDQVDDIYDHARDNGNSDRGTYDSFQKGRGREDTSEDFYDHTGASAGYGYLQNGSKATVLGDNDYDTMKNVMKGNR